MTLVPLESDPLIEPSDLASEIEQALGEDRSISAIPSAERRREHELTVMFDTAIALMLRLRLPIDASWTREVIERTGSCTDYDQTEWSASVAEHIAYLTTTDHTQETA